MTEQVLVITPGRGWEPLRLRLLWTFRELGYYLVWRELKVRYKQTLLGASWAVLQPAATTLIFAVVFGRLAKLPSDGVPYPLFAFVGMVPFVFFSQSLSQAAKSVTSGANLVSRVYFPRLLLPIGAVLSFLVDLALATIVLLPLMAYYGYVPGVELLALPLFVLLLLGTTLGVAFLLGAANAQYRDVQYVTPFILQLWLFTTPIVYPLSLVPERWRELTGLNPLVSVVEGFRWSLLGGRPPGAELAVSTAVAIALLVGGAFYFRRMERTFADVL